MRSRACTTLCQEWEAGPAHPSVRNEKPGLRLARTWLDRNFFKGSCQICFSPFGLQLPLPTTLAKVKFVCVCVYRCWKHEPSCRGQSEYKSQYSQKWSGQVSYKNVQRLCFWRWGFKLKANKNTTEHITICFSFFEGFVTLNLDPVPLNTYWTSL